MALHPGSIAALLRSKLQGLDEWQVHNDVTQLLQALEQLHVWDLVHCNIKLENLLILQHDKVVVAS